ncbi:MAG: hypothetical protein K9K82_08285 [Desulfobacteraceae bacterium]|nr:hypothetical protein [Desulfobacteraceae bacterium]
MTKDELQKLFEKEQCRELAWEGNCHDCKKPTTVVARVEDDGELQITGGTIYENNPVYIKCDECYAADPRLTDSRPARLRGSPLRFKGQGPDIMP